MYRGPSREVRLFSFAENKRQTPYQTIYMLTVVLHCFLSFTLFHIVGTMDQTLDILQVSCRTDDVLAVEAQLREWDEVEAVGSLREKQNNKADVTTVIIKCSKDTLADLKNKLKSIPEIIETQEDKSGKSTSKLGKRQKGVDVTAEIMSRIPEGERNEARNRPHGGFQRGGRGTRGRGGRGRSGRNDRNSRFTNQHPNNRRNYYRPPLVEASAAFVDNLPFGITNTRLMDIFSPFGQVLDINRLETMAMVCYSTPESVQECIQSINGSTISGHTVTVSSGTVRIPAEVVQSLTSMSG